MSFKSVEHNILSFNNVFILTPMDIEVSMCCELKFKNCTMNLTS